MELVVSMAVVGVALVGTISLTILNVSGQRASELEVIASNLAREGVEVSRGFRDSARLANSTFMETHIDCSGCPGQAEHTALVKFDPTTNTWTFDFTPDLITDPEAALSINTATGIYNHDGVGDTSLFSRLVTIDYICENSGNCSLGDGGICEDADGGDVCGEVIGQRITSEVRWNNKDEERSYILVDYLYEWK